MQAVSGDFLERIDSANPVFRVDVLQGGAVVREGLEIVGGSVEIDSTASIRRRCTLTVVDESGELVPASAGDLLAPYGNEIRVYRGLALPTGDEVVPVGTFRIAEARVADDGAPVVTLTGYDRSRSVARARFEEPYVIASGSDYADAIAAMLRSRLPSLSTTFASSGATTPLIVLDQASDPWEAATDLATSIGMDLYFNPLGVCVMGPTPDPTTVDPVLTFAEGETATILSVENALTDEPGYNGMVVDGEPPDAEPVHAVVYDDDPASPTYYLGTYGRVPTFLRSSLIRTQTQAESAARSGFFRMYGGTQMLSFAAVPNPALDVNDIVRVVRAASKVSKSNIVERVTIPLGVADPMTVTCRRRRGET